MICNIIHNGKKLNIKIYWTYNIKYKTTNITKFRNGEPWRTIASKKIVPFECKNSKGNTILVNGITTCKIIDLDTKTIYRQAMSYCMHEDEFDKTVGRHESFKRAVKSLPRYMRIPIINKYYNEVKKKILIPSHLIYKVNTLIKEDKLFTITNLYWDD